MHKQFDVTIIGTGLAGDVRSHPPMQIISACSDGANAAMAVIKQMGM